MTQVYKIDRFSNEKICETVDSAAAMIAQIAKTFPDHNDPEYMAYQLRTARTVLSGAIKMLEAPQEEQK